jgi:hypothetical protein
MQTFTHRFITFTFAILLGLVFIFQSCKKDETFPNPEIEFSTENGFHSSDTTLKLSEEITIKIIAETMSDVPLTQLHIKIDKDDDITQIDSGINTTVLNFEKTILKSTAEKETWTFYVADRDGRTSDEISITLILDESSSYGEIISIPLLILGAQNNSGTGGFYSLEDDQVYTLSEAFNNQDKINILYYYDLVGSDKNVLASPDANNDGNIDLSNWDDPKNETEYQEIETITEDEFNTCSNDSLILNNTFEFGTGKRKAKKLASGDIYSFVTHDAKKGLIKVINTDGQDEGTIRIAIKMQE